jgi:hypothetical protein
VTQLPSPPPQQTKKKQQAYEPPRILWEQTFIALAQVSEPPCIPGMDPRCS